MTEKVWLVTVFKCKADTAKDVLLNFYDFIKDLADVENLHFIIRDRLDDDVVISFRVLCEDKNKNIVKSKICFKLNNLISKEDYAIDPSQDNPLFQYGAWPWEETIKERGIEKFETFCLFLQKMSEMIIELIKQDYFSSFERTEIAHVMSWMLGCTEYFKLTTKSASVGYYDRIEDKYRAYLHKNFQ